MAEHFTLLNDEVKHIPIITLDLAGNTVPAPSGDVFSDVSSDPKVNAVIGVMPPGGPLAGAVSLDVNATVQTDPGPFTITITDTAGLTVDVATVDSIVADIAPKAISLDLTGAVSTPQPVPAS